MKPKSKPKSSSIPEIRCNYATLCDPATLRAHPQNKNQHPEGQLDKLIAMVRHQGWRRAPVVSKRSGLLITGHGLVMAALKAGWNPIPVDRQEFKSAEDELAHLIADNKAAELSILNENEVLELARSLDGKVGTEALGYDLEELLQEEPKLKELQIQKPPAMAWALIGVPIEDFAKVQKLLDELPKEATIVTTANDQEAKAEG